MSKAEAFIDHLTLPVRDLEASWSFYRRALAPFSVEEVEALLRGFSLGSGRAGGYWQAPPGGEAETPLAWHSFPPDSVIAGEPSG